MEIVIIGTGNVATILGQLMLKAGHVIQQVYGRNEEKTIWLARQLGCTPMTNLAEITSRANLYLVAVSDKAIDEIARQLRLGEALVVHTAGSIPMNILHPVSKNFGVLYPLQSLNKAQMPTADIPLLVDGNTEENLHLVSKFAKTLSPMVQACTDEARLHLHVSAVIVNNFTNHLYQLAWEYCQSSGLDFQLLLPLIQQTTLRLSANAPAKWQTGPAQRKDENTIGRHLELLQAYPPLQHLYQELSTSIMNHKS